MTKAHDTTGARVLVGIDISKHRHEVLIAVPGKTRRRRMTVLNTAADYRRLIEALRGFELPVTIGFEATGNYHRALMFALGAAGFELKLERGDGPFARARHLGVAANLLPQRIESPLERCGHLLRLSLRALRDGHLRGADRVVAAGQPHCLRQRVGEDAGEARSRQHPAQDPAAAHRLAGHPDRRSGGAA